MFKLQVKGNPVYRQFVKHLGLKPGDVKSSADIPFLPIRFFKSHSVILRGLEEEVVFESSGTTGSETSKHYVHDPEVYEKSCLSGFRRTYGNPSDYCILALLPSYLERSNSSLVHMAKLLIKESDNRDSGFYLDKLSSLAKLLKKNSDHGKKTLLIGVTFALLELAEKYPMRLSECIIMETGGMKGRRKELTREEVHSSLKQAFEINTVHSEYGMTELLSQAYSTGNGKFECPPWMKVSVRDITDPLSSSPKKTGVINVIDLANIYSCPFIATDDLGKLNSDGTFEVLGRLDNAQIRGCNLMVT